MKEGHPRSEDSDGSDSSPLPKRRKVSGHDGDVVVSHTRRESPSPRHNDYNIAWICALPIEMAAASAMLDKIHEPLPMPEQDTNAYTLGHIGHHNIVIAGLPMAEYGTNNAASVLAHLVRSFLKIRIGLMVGIGGGVPSMADIRLGDVVVGTRVMQYDLGKIGDDEKIRRTANPKPTSPLLGKFVSALRARHELKPTRIPAILQETLGDHPSYGHPSSPDRLFNATYVHNSSWSSCENCDNSQLVPRSTRPSDDPVIHHGGIASSNQVMKNSTVRDTLARQLEAICFEMETAGLIDIPCLPIRGICDYSDSHKGKEWQRYAAATAAAYARELLEILPPTLTYAPAGDAERVNRQALQRPRQQSDTAVVRSHQADQESPQDRRRRLLNSLKFEQIDSRRLTINSAHARTCQWLLSHPDYQAWENSGQHSDHHGFLWIRGKPGAGKSTIMKFAYLHAQKQALHRESIIASFFFHARGEKLQKSMSGMYRSLLVQLLQGYSDLQAVLEDPDLDSQSLEGWPLLNVLEDLFLNAMSGLGQRPFTCFIDALDECDEQQVKNMVQSFEDLADDGNDHKKSLRICFASRHYPYIDIKWGIRLTLEDQPGHLKDLTTYVASRLRLNETTLAEKVQAEEIRAKVLNKAAGVFLWVYLVVDILNQEGRGGGLAMQKRLDEVPSGLSELFKDIVTRDHRNMEHLLLCVLWILCAERPLKPEEFYHAFWCGLILKDLADPTVPAVTSLNVDGTIFRSVTSSSKGLAEITATKRSSRATPSKQPVVQFIYESVRDFLIKDKGLHELWPEIGFNWEAPSHERLKECCHMYLKQASIRKFIMKKSPDEETTARQARVSRRYPFLEYANQHVLYHANIASEAISQEEFLSELSLKDWITINNLFEKFKIRRYGSTANLTYLLADRGYSRLIRIRLAGNKKPHVHAPSETYRYPLFAAMAKGHSDAVAALLGFSTNSIDGASLLAGLPYKHDFMRYKGRTPLSWAAQEGQMSLATLLLHSGADVNEEDREGQTPLSRASGKGREDLMRLLIGKGAKLSYISPNGHTALSCAAENGHDGAIRLLLENKVRVYTNSWQPPNPLCQALANGHETTAKLLIREIARVHGSPFAGKSPLLLASEKGYKIIAKLLIKKGASIWDGGKRQPEPLVVAAENGHEELVRILLAAGAKVDGFNDKQPGRITPLVGAVSGGQKGVVELLVEEGANVNDRDTDYKTPLAKAAELGLEEIALFLLDKGANVNGRLSGNRNETPLCCALYGGHEAMVRLLIEKGADINFGSYDDAPLPWAVQNGQEEMVKLLIGYGANVNGPDPHEKGPLSLAVDSGHEAIVKLLIGNGANINGGGEWHNPLACAVQRKDWNMAKLLLDSGAVPITVFRGDSLLCSALDKGDEAHARLLFNVGAVLSFESKSSRLRTALEKGLEPIAKLLVENGANLDCRLKDSLVREALEKGNEPQARLLFDMGAVLSFELKASQLYTALDSGLEPIAKLLFEKGANLDCRLKDSFLYKALERGNEAMARLLFDQGGDLKPSLESSLLLSATEQGHDAIKSLLLLREAQRRSKPVK